MGQSLRIAATHGSGGAWTAAVAAAAVALGGLVLLYRDTVAGMIVQWSTSSAYNYCFLVVPIAGFLAWERRGRLAALQPAPCWPALALLPPLGAAWWIADLADLAEGRQLALVAMAVATLVVVLGARAARVLALPLLYLFLMVPMGELLVGPLQRLAAAAVEAALRLAGLPVFRDGVLLQVPTGWFVVEPGCAGLNFLLSALALSLLFADLLFRRWAKRIACVVLALLAALLVNWLRIWGLIVIDALSNGTSGLIHDHLLYGWALFALATLGLVLLAQRHRDDPAPPPAAVPDRRRPGRPLQPAAALGALLLAAGPLLAFGPSAMAAPEAGLELPAAVGSWRLVERRSDGADAIGIYDGPGGRVELAVGALRPGGIKPFLGGGEAGVAGRTEARIDGRAVAVLVLRRPAGAAQRISWRWLALGERFTADGPSALLAQAGALLWSRPAPRSISLSAGTPPEAGPRLQSFLDAWQVGATLRRPPARSS
ncbi:MAG: exosortase A [Dongiaceae bacterium]